MMKIRSWMLALALVLSASAMALAQDAREQAKSQVEFGIKVAPFDSAAVAPALRAAGAEVLTAEPSLIRFRDNYGITLEVIAS